MEPLGACHEGREQTNLLNSDHTRLLNYDHTNLLNAAVEELAHQPRDLAILAKDGTLEVNRLLLSMYSPTILGATSTCISCSSSFILLPDFAISSVHALIHLLTRGFVSIRQICSKDFENILEIGKLLQIKINHKNLQVFVEEATILDDARIIEEETCEDLTEKFHHKKFRLATSKENKNNETVHEKDEEVLEARCEIMASPLNKKTEDDYINVSSTSERSNWLKRMKVQEEVAKYSFQELLEKALKGNLSDTQDKGEEKVKESNSIKDKPAIPRNKRKRKPAKQNSVQGKNFKKIRLEKEPEPTNSDTEINLPGKPIFIRVPDNLSDLDDSYDESVLVVDLKESPKSEEANPPKFVDNISQDLDSQLEMVDNKGASKQKPSRRKANSIRFTEEQRAGLRNAFEENNFVSREKAQILSMELCLTEKQVKKWFNWYRAKLTKTRTDKLQVEGESMDIKTGNEQLYQDDKFNSFDNRDTLVKVSRVQHENLLDEEYNEYNVSPLKSGVRVKYDMAGISRINDIADIKERKGQSGEPNCKEGKSQSGETTSMEGKIQSGESNCKEGKSHSGEPNGREGKIQSEETTSTNKVKSKTYWYDLLLTNEASPREESIRSSPAAAIDSSTDVTEKYVNNCTPPNKPKTNQDNDFSKSVTKRNITRYSEHQKETLGKAFDENNFLMKGQAQELSEELCLTEKQVKDWFRGQRRSKARKDKAKQVDKTEDVEDKDEDSRKYEAKQVDETEEVEDEDSESAAGTSLKYTCELCSKTFSSKIDFSKHISSHNWEAFSTDDIGNDGKKVEDEQEIQTDNDQIQNGKKAIENLFEASDNEQNHFQCECGETSKNALLLKFHKNECCGVTIT